MRRTNFAVGVAAALLASAAPAAAEDLTRYSLEDLLTLQATSVAKKRQRVADAAAAVFVITQEDIRRSGARTIPDLLRMVPGVEVGSIDGNSTAVSMRGFNTRFANSVLVLVNGRAIYVSALSGVLWDQLLDPLDQIERIEVVRGPGATLWGANAVNGIINIITKDTAQARGVTANTRSGTDGQDVALQAGGGDAETGYRVTGAARRKLASALTRDGGTAPIETQGAQLSAQIDAAPDADNALTFKAGIGVGKFGPAKSGLGDLGLTAGGFTDSNVLVRWSRGQADASSFMAQGFVNHVSRDESGISIRESIYNVEANGNIAVGSDELGFGINYRLTQNILKSQASSIGFLSDGSSDNLVSGFVQYDHWLVSDKVRLTVGTKLENSSITGFNVQPSVRLLGRIGDARLWLSASRAVRTPSLLERDAHLSTTAGPTGRFYSPIFVDVTASGTPSLRSARLDSLEAGVRFNIGESLKFDIAAYHNRYKDLVGAAPLGADIRFDGGMPRVTANYALVNNSDSTSTGVEAAVTWTATSSLRMDGYYSFIDSRFQVRPVFDASGLTPLLAQFGYSLPLFPQPGLMTTPRQQGGVRAHWDVGPNVEIDGWLRHVGELKNVGVPAYTTFDLRAAVQLSGNVTLSLVGQNLLDKNRLEFRESLVSAAPAVISRQIAFDLRLRM
ncbi:TonB-dependent receptor plug domain-containing protein [Sphingomonas floccifaciens]|uniref:TonB-dependent receptor plug domain-containing protein n=1 Tax=Sphingomonas floccifaciens TaxID=1844115 RepID=A0ABW4ND88_9SPHN